MFCVTVFAVAPAIGHGQRVAALPSVSQQAPGGPATVSRGPGFPRWLAMASLGLPVRLSRNVDLGQEWLAPWYVDGLVGYLFGAAGPYQHGPALGASLGLSDDGGFYEPVSAFSQGVITPSYVLARQVTQELMVSGHVGLPVAISGKASVGAELAAAGGYRIFAGFGAFVELGGAMFVGVAGAVHPLVSVETGLFIDYEVLP